MSTIGDIVQSALQKIPEAQTQDALLEVEKEFLGKDGSLSQVLKGVKDLSPEEKKSIGKEANEAKNAIFAKLNDRKKEIIAADIQKRVDQEWLDVTLPGKRSAKFEGNSSVHPYTLVEKLCVDIFKKMGFATWKGNHIVDDYENFGALNFPDDHPARDMYDTFYLEGGYLLRAHTSALQNAILKTKDFPIRAIVPGRVFRYEATDARHEVIFTQLEGVMVDKNINVSHLIAVLQHFLRELFGKEVKFRIRPGYFPFVEPGMELEIDCLICHGKGCGLCKGLGWTEVMPCGMIHPNVLEEAGIDSKEYSGYAFGFGLSRLAQMLYGIEDARKMYTKDVRMLSQFQ